MLSLSNAFELYTKQQQQQQPLLYSPFIGQHVLASTSS